MDTMFFVLHLLFWSYTKLMIVFLCINHLPYYPTVYPLSTSTQWDGLRVQEGGKRVKKQGLTLEIMVKPQPHNRASGQGRRGRRHQEGKGKEVGSSSSQTAWQMHWKMNSKIPQAIVEAYCEGTLTQVKQLITTWKEDLNLKVGLEPLVDDWWELITNPVNTYGCLALFRQSIHLYWLMKCIVAK